MELSVSVIIPAYNAGGHLSRCLAAIRASSLSPFEVIVIDDGSKDDTCQIARDFQATSLDTGGRRGPAFARNLGAKVANGDILLFLDSDCSVQTETLSKICVSFQNDPTLDALIGSYDSNPSAPDFISQYRNLMHCYVHQTGAQNASTFWSGCGAIRRNLFIEHSGFNEQFGRPAIEDMELGYRLIEAKCKIMLDRSIQVTHMKRWTFWNLVKTDIFDRGIPWTELILRSGTMPDDLNLQLSQRVSVALVFILVALGGFMAFISGGYALIPLFFVVFLMLARWWGEMGNYQRPKSAFAMLTGVLAIVGVAAYSMKMYVLIPFLTVTPVLLLLRHRYNRRGAVKKWQRDLGLLFISASVLVSAAYLPGHGLIFVWFAILVVLGLLNSQFYIFLASHRGLCFMIAAIPFHLLYHFYNGISLIAGAGQYFLFENLSLKIRRGRASV